MSEDRGHCPDCGGSDGFHYSDCIYDGTDGPRGYYSGSRGGSSGSGGKVWLFYIVALVIGYGNILAEIDEYKEQVEYWNEIPEPIITGRFPKYMETDLDVIGDGSHGYLIIGGWYNDSQLISSVLAICDDDNRVRKIPEAMSREIVSKLTDGCVEEKNCDANSVGKVIEHVENLLYDDMCAGKVGELAANRRKMEIWLNYRKEEFLLNMKDTSEISKLQEEYQAEKNFKLKIQLKKKIEELEKEKENSEAAFQEKMQELEVEASELTSAYETELLKKPSLYAKIVVKY